MKAIFADSYFFIAVLNPNDRAHRKASTFPLNDYRRIVTTRWILTEVADAFVDRTARGAAVLMLRRIQTDPKVIIISKEPEYFDRGVDLYARRHDKEWSLTDCISFVAMADAGTRDALTADKHFEQAGFRALLK